MEDKSKPAHVDDIAAPAEKVSDFCKGRFAPLRSYFRGVLLDDLPKMSRADVLAVVPRRYRLLLIVFLATYVCDPDAPPPTQPTLLRRYHLQSSPESWPPIDAVYTLHEPRVFSLRRLLHPSALLSPSLLGSRELPPEYAKALQTGQGDAHRRLELVNLAENHLGDEHMPGLLHLLLVLLGDVTKGARMVDVSGNRFAATSPCSEAFADQLIQLLQALAPEAVLDLTFTPAASMDNIPLFHRLYTTPSLHAETQGGARLLGLKVIWMPPSYLENPILWRAMVPGQASTAQHQTLMNDTRRVHEDYYLQRQALPR